MCQALFQGLGHSKEQNQQTSLPSWGLHSSVETCSEKYTSKCIDADVLTAAQTESGRGRCFQWDG